jgi:hypothetical protein
MSDTSWPLTEFLTVVGMLGASFWVIYTEIRSIRRESKEDFDKLQKLIREDFESIRQQKKAEIEQLKLEIKQELNDVKQTFKSDLFGHRTDLKSDMHEISRNQKKDIEELRRTITNLTEKIVIIDTTIAFLRDDHPINHPPFLPPSKSDSTD